MAKKLRLDWSSPGRTGTNIRSKKVTNTKGSSLTKNSAALLSPEQIAIKKEADRIRRRANEKNYHDRVQAQKKIQVLTDELKKLQKDVEDKKKVSVDLESVKILNDMRYVYSKVDGRKKLLKMVKDDEKQFSFMVKELIKLETTLAASKLGGKGGKGIGGEANQNYFVILKGLDQDKQLAELKKEQEEKQNADVATTNKLVFSSKNDDSELPTDEDNPEEIDSNGENSDTEPESKDNPSDTGGTDEQ